MKEAHNSIIVNDLTQSLIAMSKFKVLQTSPSQKKSLLSILRVVDPSNSYLITIDLNKSKPHLPDLVAFQIPMIIINITIH